MANRFSVKIPVTQDPNEKETAALHVKEIAETDYETAVCGAALPVVLDFYSANNKPCEDLAPRFAAVAAKFAGKVQFMKILRKDGDLSAKLGITSSPTLVFFKEGKESGERLCGDEIKRTALKSGVEALLGQSSPVPQVEAPA